MADKENVKKLDKNIILDIENLKTEYKAKTQIDIFCKKCGRSWSVPKNCDNVRPLRLSAQPPDDLPAGNCPECDYIYCIACAKKTLGDDGRFRCLSCGKNLKLNNKGVIYLLTQWNKENESHNETTLQDKKDMHE